MKPPRAQFPFEEKNVSLILLVKHPWLSPWESRAPLDALTSCPSAFVGDKLVSNVCVELPEISVLGIRCRVSPNEDQALKIAGSPFFLAGAAPCMAAIDAKHKTISPIKRGVKG